MIYRYLYLRLIEWKNSENRKPLILRGARQTGKTTLINEFGQEFDQYLYFNLEKDIDKEIFKSVSNLEKCIPIMFLSRNKILDKKRSTLIFIDEVQEAPAIIESLRYFFEDYNYLHIIITGSLLDFALAKIEKTPVGRVEYMELHPLNFNEFLHGMSNQSVLNALNEIPINNDVLPIVFPLFHDFAMIGGMPEIMANFINNKNVTVLLKLYASILESYKSDVEKYAKNENQKLIIRHIIDTAAYEVDHRIQLNKFGGSSFNSREIKEAMTTLEKARYLELVYPTTQVIPPGSSDYNKRPRLHLLDVGLQNYQLALFQELLQLSDLNNLTRGSLVQQVVTQEIKSLAYLPSKKLKFWVREEKNASSEVDLVYPYKQYLIPIEFKAGATGTLRSLHEFMDRTNHHFAIRFYGGRFSIDKLTTRLGKEYLLLNLPYFLAAWIENYITWFLAEYPGIELYQKR